MKKSRILLVAVALLTVMGLTSCEKTADKILGSWEVTSCKVIDGDEDIEMEGSIWTFKEGKVVTIGDDEGVYVSGTYSIDGDKIVMSFVGAGDDEGMTLALDGEVTEITDSKMVFDGTMTASGAKRSISSKVNITFNKK